MKYYKTIQINGKQVRLHRYVMEQKLGRKLLFNEIVHHKDENKHNNNIDNLELVSRSIHKKIHYEIGEKTRFKTIHDIDINIITEMYKTMSIEKISIYFNVAIGTIYNKMKKNNIKTNKRGYSFKN